MANDQITISVEDLKDKVSDLVSDALMKAIKGKATIKVDKVDSLVAEFMKKVTKEQSGDLTINGLVEMSYGTARANGWHDRTGDMLTKDHPYVQLAGLTHIKLALGRVVEAIRKPDKFNLQDQINELSAHVDVLRRFGPAFAAETVPMAADELQTPAQGSLTEILAWLHLIDSESAEAMEAAIKGDRENFAEELAADIPIRIGDAVGAINDHLGHRLGPIDVQATILAKNERNKTRGHMHGGKRA